MKKSLFITSIIAVFCWSLNISAFAVNDDKPKKISVYINQTTDHPALDTTTKGIIAALANSGYKANDNLDLRIESAQGMATLSQQIANKFVGQAPTIVVGVGTVAAQSFIKYAKLGQIKMVFSTVTDPLGAGLVNDLQKPGGNISGVSNFVQLEPQLELFKKLLPSLKKLGILYNPGEANSVSIVQKLEKLCPKFDLILIKQTASKTADVAQSATKLAESSEAIFISNDNTALSAMQSIIKAANEATIPVFVSDTDAIGSGAVAALGPNQYQVGWQTGKMIVRIAQDSDNALPAVEFPESTELYLDLNAAKKLGINVSQDIIKQAAKIIE
ncbi:ABC transporter substrate-binding protein [Candidatus Trichorickettsia mobilis]|uniref:ABC transporter substrate-binding protein n=1 Tax=Candidatus Trichorickettsia mobilis TaxID=1346319 RepID=UPI00292F05FA|nr:ABC transporter substrate-binding protein [Candidatus Trichorickettsia mobilis]